MKDGDTQQDKSNKYPQATITFFICSFLMTRYLHT